MAIQTGDAEEEGSGASNPATGRPDPNGRRSLLERYGGLALTVVALVLAAVCVIAIPQLRHALSLTIHGNLSGLRSYIRGLHGGGEALLFALMLGHTIVNYPTEILSATSGYIYGFAGGLVLAMCGWAGAALLSYGIGRTVGRPLLHAILGKRFATVEAAIETGGIQLMLSARLIPIVPFSLLGYVSGATRARLWTFMWTSVIGYLPLTAAVVYLGSQSKNLSVNNPLIWLAVVLLVGLLVVSQVLTRRSRKRATAANSSAAESFSDQTP